MELLIFVFARVSCGRRGAILAEFAPVPNVQPDPPDTSATDAASDVRAAREESTRSLEIPVREYGGPAGPEPTRFGDWEKNGRCIDF